MDHLLFVEFCQLQINLDFPLVINTLTLTFKIHQFLNFFICVYFGSLKDIFVKVLAKFIYKRKRGALLEELFIIFDFPICVCFNILEFCREVINSLLCFCLDLIQLFLEIFDRVVYRTGQLRLKIGHLRFKINLQNFFSQFFFNLFKSLLSRLLEIL